MQKDDATWLNVSYAIVGLLGLYVFYKIFETAAIQLDLLDKFSWWQPASFVLSAILSVLCVYLYVKDPDTREYHLSSIAELRKVTWPTYDVTVRLTWIVVIFVAIFAAILALFDSLWSNLLKLIIS